MSKFDSACVEEPENETTTMFATAAAPVSESGVQHMQQQMGVYAHENPEQRAAYENWVRRQQQQQTEMQIQQ